MNRKGFTLVELLGVIVILSIIMLIAIPNITSTLERSKRDQYIVDAKKMISLADTAIRNSGIQKPASDKWIKVTLKDLETTDVEEDPEGYVYDENKSFVIITRKNGTLKYYVSLVANHSKDENDNWYGIKLAGSDELKSEDRYQLINKGVNLPTEADINDKTQATR